MEDKQHSHEILDVSLLINLFYLFIFLESAIQ